MADWRTAYLRALGAKPTPAAMDFLAKWQPYEGGHTNNAAKFNYLNTTTRMPGSTGINSVGVQSFKTLGQGAQAFAKTLKGNANYAGLLSFLMTGQGDPTSGLSTWLSGSPTGGLAYATKVMGGKVPTQPIDGAAEPPTTGVTPDATLEAPTARSMASVRSQAAQGFADIAQGKMRATDTFAPLLATLKAAHTSMPQVQIPTLTQGGSKVENQAATLVKKYLGTKYVFGGAAPGGFDCSGLVQYVYKSLGIKIPRIAADQFRAGKPVAQADLRPGDAVFWVGVGTAENPGHMGMYIGDGKAIVAPHTGAVVRVEQMSDHSDFLGARRFT